MRLQSISLGLLAISLPMPALTMSPAAMIPAPDSVAYQICETYPEGTKLGDLNPCAKARVLEDVVCKYAPIDGESPHKALKKHAKCLCNSHFFLVKKACHHCVRGHGGMSEQQNNFYDEALRNAHRNFCLVDTPPDVFAKVWLDEVDAPSGDTVSGDTALVDEFGTSTAVRLYFTSSPTASPTPDPNLSSAVLKLQSNSTSTASTVPESRTGKSNLFTITAPVTGPVPTNFNSSLSKNVPGNGSFVIQSPHSHDNETVGAGTRSHDAGQHVLLPLVLALGTFVSLL